MVSYAQLELDGIGIAPYLLSKITVMTKRMIWTLFAVAAAGITVYLVRNRRSTDSAELESNHDQIPGKRRRRPISAFTRQKSYANGDLNP
jgi:hypothetical protein